MAFIETLSPQSYHQPKGCRNKVKNGEKGKKLFYGKNLAENPKHEERIRLRSFAKYPRDMSCSPMLLARNGFMYTGNGASGDDLVACVFCSSVGKGVSLLKGAEDIKKFHRKLNPHCSIVKGLECGNKLIEVSGKQSFEAILSKLYGMRRNEMERGHIPPCDKENRLPHNDPNLTHLEDDSPNVTDSHPPLREVPHSRNTTFGSSSPHHIPRNFQQQAVEDEASSQIITNNAISLYYPWQDGVSAPTASLVTVENHPHDDSSLPLSDGSVRADGTSRSPPPPRDITDASASVTMPSSNGNESVSTDSQQLRSDSSRPREHNSAAPDSIRAQGSEDVSPEPRTSARDTIPQPPPENSSSLGNEERDGTTSYERLGICTARPKRPEYAVEHVRLQSFEGWPVDHFLKPEVLAQAGFFYTGYSDCARCFFCGGGLRNWEDGDDVWVEHARWFQKCTFIRQSLGQTFIDVVQDLSKAQEIIPFQDVVTEMEARGLQIEIPRDIANKSSGWLKKDVAVRTVIDNGFSVADAIPAAEKVKEMGQLLTSDLIFEELVRRGARKSSQNVRNDIDSESFTTRGRSSLSEETMESLTNKNNELRQQSQCKICLDKEVSVVFLPCGHFVSCLDCSFPLKSCPMCRESIKGVVKGSLS